MNTIFYGLKHKCPDGVERFFHIFPHPKLALMCGSGPVYELELRETEKGEVSDYWGWYDNEKNDYSMIYPNKTPFKMCFPYGYEAEEKAGKGRAVNLVVVERGIWKKDDV